MIVFEFIEGKKADFVIVRDLRAGRANRYKVYRLRREGLKTPKIIGRELTLSLSRKVVEKSDQ